MPEPHRETPEETVPAIMVLDPEQPLCQAGFTAWLLDTHLRQYRARAPRGHHWCCVCLRTN